MGSSAHRLLLASLGSSAATAAAFSFSFSGLPWRSPSLLQAREDAYGGIIIDSVSLPPTSAAFRADLAHSLAQWRAAGRRGVWLTVPHTRAALVPEAVIQNFGFHHADAGSVTLTRWLPDDGSSTLPPGPSTQVGVGALVFNGRGEVLMVKERTGPAARRDIWKVPTGLVERGEDLVSAARRELLEETGVSSTADGARVVAFRHASVAKEGAVGDVFFLVRMSVDAVPRLTPQEAEIAEARWMPLEEVRQLDYYREGTALHDMVFHPGPGLSGVDRGRGHVYR